MSALRPGTCADPGNTDARGPWDGWTDVEVWEDDSELITRGGFLGIEARQAGAAPSPCADALFALPTAALPRGADAQRTARSRALLDAGYHPVVRIRLHPDAPPVDDRAAEGPRCGNCAHLTRKHHNAKTYLKCGEHVTAGPGTDLRAWWPACAAWAGRDGQP